MFLWKLNTQLHQGFSFDGWFIATEKVLTHWSLGDFNKILKIIVNLILVTDDISSDIALRWITLDLCDDKSTLVQVMAWCRQASSHYLNPCWPRSQWVNSSPPSAAYMHQWNGSALVQVMACCLFGTKPLPEPMLTYCQLDCWEQISVKLESKFYHFHSRKCIWNCRLPKWRPFCPWGDELTHQIPRCLFFKSIWDFTFIHV